VHTNEPAAMEKKLDGGLQFKRGEKRPSGKGGEKKKQEKGKNKGGRYSVRGMKRTRPRAVIFTGVFGKTYV